MNSEKEFDQIPSGGCERCGKGDGLSQPELRKILKKEFDLWLCSQCRKELKERRH